MKLFPVSSKSRRRLRDVSISCGDVAETNFVRDWEDVSATSAGSAGDQGDWGDVVATLRRCLRDAAWPFLETTWLSTCWHRDAFIPGLGRRPGVALVRAQAIFWSPELPEFAATSYKSKWSRNRLSKCESISTRLRSACSRNVSHCKELELVCGSMPVLKLVASKCLEGRARDVYVCV